MAGVDMFSLGTGGLFAARTALDVTSHNIANVNTDGYSRQRAEFNTNSPIQFGGNYFGTGVGISDITRIFDNIANIELINTRSAFNEKEAFFELSSRVDGLLSDPSTGVSSSLQTFFDSLQSLSNDPSSLTEREVVFNQVQTVTNRFNTLYDQLGTLKTSVEIGIQSITTEINTLGNNIAKLNQEISNAVGGGAATPNDLLDKRDQLLSRLSELIGVSTLEQQDGTVNVFVGNGQGLVVGGNFSAIGTTPNPENPSRLDIVLDNGTTQVPITNLVTGGRLGGLLQFRDGVLENSLSRLGKIAMGFADSLNSQNNLGMDINDALGANLFNDINATVSQQNRVLTHANNTGNLALQVQIDSVNNLTDDNYRLTYAAGTTTYTLTNTSTGAVEATFPQPGATPATVAIASLGFSITLNSGASADGDSYLILPTQNGAREISRAITSGSQIAAASPIKFTDGVSNLGTGSIVSSNVTDITNAAFSTTAGQLTPPVRIEFTSATTYNIVNNTTNAVIEGGLVFTPNSENQVLPTGVTDFGYEVNISGAPSLGDTFVIDYNDGGIGDNRNVLLMSGLQTAKNLEGGTATFQTSYNQLVGTVGVQTREASIDTEVSGSLLTQAINRREEISGVNLDEEAANLIKFQQAYEASAQIITIANSLFQTLIGSLR